MSVKETAKTTALILHILANNNGNILNVAEIADKSDSDSYEFCKEILTELALHRWVIATDRGYLGAHLESKFKQATDMDIQWISNMLVDQFEHDPARPRLHWKGRWLDPDVVHSTKN